MTCAKYDYEVCKGETFREVVRWATDPLVSRPVASITQAAPVSISCTAYGAPDGWPMVVTGAQGMTQMNSQHYPPQGRDWHTGTKQDPNTVTFNKVDSSLFSPHVPNSGFLVYPTPVNMTGMTPAFKVYDNVDMTGTPLLSLSAGSGITVDTAASTITVQFATDALTWTSGFYTLSMTDAALFVHHVLEGNIALT